MYTISNTFLIISFSSRQENKGKENVGSELVTEYYVTTNLDPPKIIELYGNFIFEIIDENYENRIEIVQYPHELSPRQSSKYLWRFQLTVFEIIHIYILPCANLVNNFSKRLNNTKPNETRTCSELSKMFILNLKHWKKYRLLGISI